MRRKRGAESTGDRRVPRGSGAPWSPSWPGGGFQVIATARKVEDLDGLPAAARRPLEVTSDASVAAAVETAGPVGVLVNNAAVSVAAPAEDTPAGVALADVRHQRGQPAAADLAFVPGMRQRGGGTVVSVSSVGGQAAFPHNGANAATKDALEALSETLAMEVRRFVLRVLVIQLSGVATGMYDKQERYSSPRTQTWTGHSRTPTRTIGRARST